MVISEAEIAEKWQNLTELQSLKEILTTKLKRSNRRGIDRLNIEQFSRQADRHLCDIQRKCSNGSYRFSPYLEILQQKGRGKAPRLIGVPTVRDKIVLYALKELLAEIFPECVPRKLSNTYIHDIQRIFKNLDLQDLQSILVLRTDIKNFYPSVQRKILLEKLLHKISSPLILKLIKRAINTPIVPKTSYRKKEKHKYKESQGIPQGLSISNILAAIYISEIDMMFKDIENINYYRYVDDILIFYPKAYRVNVHDKLKDQCINIGLEIHELDNKSKGFQGSALDNFDYLGYSFSLPKITIKQASVDRFIDSIAALFSKYPDWKAKMLKKHKYLTQVKIKEIFLRKLNERITGAISHNKRYGWLFYYNAVSDISVFYKIDNIIEKFFKRLEDFNKEAPSELKKLSKAYYEGKHNLYGGYIHNYNPYKTREEKMDFLNEEGMIDPEKGYSEEEINEMYESEKNRNLARLEQDDATIY